MPFAGRITFKEIQSPSGGWSDEAPAVGRPGPAVFSPEEVGAARGLLPINGGDCESALECFARGSICAGKLAEQLEREGAEASARSWNDLMLASNRRLKPCVPEQEVYAREAGIALAARRPAAVANARDATEQANAGIKRQ
jgi:hypothetical protein